MTRSFEYAELLICFEHLSNSLSKQVETHKVERGSSDQHTAFKAGAPAKFTQAPERARSCGSAAAAWV